jgi:MFS family permease
MVQPRPVTAAQGKLLRWRDIPPGVWALGVVSLFMDLSSEMIHALLPLYFVAVLGTPVVLVGVIEGIAEATASIVKIFSGALSDRLGRRKLLVAGGYGLAALTKPVFPLASSVGWLVAARFGDRLGKGIRGAPRDALIADLTPPEIRGSAYGLRQSLDTVGAVLGPLLAMLFMLWTASNFTIVFWIAVVPAFLSFAVILFGVPIGSSSASRRSSRWRDSARPSCSCARNRSGSRWRSLRPCC